MKPAKANDAPRTAFPWMTVVLSVGLTFVFWLPLWLGWGLIGGDLYSYALPQKAFLADSLARGELPLWNPLVGQGYPLLAESQTGVLYPLHLVCYGLLDVQTAFNVIMLAHYIAAFLAMAWCARWHGLNTGGALLAAVVYVYGWFPVRSSLDWAILGGVYLPLALGCVEAYWQTSRSRYALGLSLAIGLQLLGGHYQIAFLTWLLLAGYGAWRWGRSRELRVESREPEKTTSERSGTTWDLRQPAVVLSVAFVLGVGLAAVQLLPTWELKTRSQRETIGGEHEPAYGHIPPIYLSQVALPWVWYDPEIDIDAALVRLSWLSVPAATNRVEAHLYFGQLPLYLALWGVVSAWNGRNRDRSAVFWSVVIVLSTIYATGWMLPALRYVPGFNFFRSPGRAGLLATFAVALLAGRTLNHLSQTRSGAWPRRLAVFAIVITVADLWWFPRAVSYAIAVERPAITYRDESVVRQILEREAQPPRLFAPGANLPTLLGVSAVPVYLGLGPEEYFDPALRIPEVEPDDFHTFSPERYAWLQQGGVTHILSFEPLERRGWPVEPVWAGMDPFLNRAWGRFNEPIFLHRLPDASGRITWTSPSDDRSATLQSAGSDQVQLTADSVNGGRLVLKDLAYPGWQVTVDGQPVTQVVDSEMFRAVDLPPGRHDVIWSYRPASVYWGTIFSGIAAVFLAGGSWVLARRTRA